MLKYVVPASIAAIALVAPADATTFTSTELSQASDGLQMMRELNVITYNDLNGTNHVQGKGFVGGSLTNNTTFGQGNGSAGEATSNRPTVAVVNNISGGVTLQNNSNGGNGNIATTPEVDVGKNFSSTANTSVDGVRVQVGGNLAGFQNVNGGPAISYGGSYGGSNTGNGRVAQDTTIAAGGTADLYASLNSQRTTMMTDLSKLSSVLANLTTNGTMSTTGSNVTFDFSGLSSGTTYGVYTIDAATLFSYNGALTVNPGTTANGAYRPVVINVTGSGSYTDSVNMNLSDAIAQNVIFNFVGASSLTVNSNFTGSLLAPNTTVSNSSNITGSVVANVLNQNAEIHLGTYSGTSAVVANNAGSAGAVPEASTWAMMLVGFGLIGGTVRSQRRRGNLLAA